MLIDTHCHLDFDWFNKDRDDVVKRAIDAGVARIVVPAIDLGNCLDVIDLAERYEGVYAAVGVHPNSSAEWQESWVERLRELAGHEKVVAIGEIGLDYYRDRSPRSVQRRALQMQLELAADENLPVIIHNREADADLLKSLSTSRLVGRDRAGVLHSFSAGWDTAEAALEMGFFLGFTGPVTYKTAEALRGVVARTPLDRILVETDAPFLAPQRYRGKRNEPSYVTLVAEKVAEIRDLDVSSIGDQTTENAVRLFGEQLR